MISFVISCIYFFSNFWTLIIFFFSLVVFFDNLRVFSNQVLPQLLLNPNKIRLRRCRCAIYFDCVPEPFRVSDKINGSRTHLVNPKNDRFFGQCERCRTKQREFKVKNADRKKEVDKAYCLREDIKERRREKQQTPEFKEWRRKNQQQPMKNIYIKFKWSILI